jgi:Fe-S-cluster containining protein
MVGPHEVLGMSRVLGLSTTEFLERYGDNGGTTLRYGADGRCAFVAPEGCRVHARRPLVCRLYPLGRAVDGAGVESFGVFPKESGCGAALGSDGTVARFLAEQGVEPYFEWSRRYAALYKRMLGLLDRMGIEGRVEARQAKSGAGGPAEEREPVGAAPLSSWQDIDASLKEYCAAQGMAVPAGIEAAIDMHLAAMTAWLDGLEKKL